MFVYSEIQPHLIFLIIVLVLSWSLATWLNWQNRKMHCELIPQFMWISRYGLFSGTILMIFSLWFLSLFYGELRLGMTVIFAAIMVGIGSYLARFFEWLVFMQEIIQIGVIKAVSKINKIEIPSIPNLNLIKPLIQLNSSMN